MLLKLLHKAADTAEANSRRGLETAQQLSDKLEAAKDRINELEGHLEFYRGKIERAEAWLYKIASEIEERLIREPEERRRGTSGRS
jgi:predicted  nucleic acid-binding Zn-ribbon protein